MTRLLVGELGRHDQPLKGTKLNWLNRPLGKRAKHPKWIKDGEDYYVAVQRIKDS